MEMSSSPLKVLLCKEWMRRHSSSISSNCEFNLKLFRRLFQTEASPRSIPVTVKESYSLLEIDEGCSENELREAYLRKVKEYHPDRSENTKDSVKFNQVQEAYQVALEHQKGKADIIEETLAAQKDPYDYDIQHTVPQHRRYLTLEGIGSGTPSQRQRQYKQYRFHQAAENVFEHRKMKLSGDESAVVLRDKEQARKIKISNFMERVVDDLIRESMQKGDFDDLPGKGKPLDYSSHNPLVDTTTHNVNKILVNNGFKPEWIMLSKEIRDEICLARERLAVIREQLGPPSSYSETNEIRWKFHVAKFKESISDINLKINRFNNIVPLMEKQMVHYDAERNMQKVLDDHQNFLPKNKEGQPMDISQLPPCPQAYPADDRINWAEVWTNIKELFRSR